MNAAQQPAKATTPRLSLFNPPRVVLGLLCVMYLILFVNRVSISTAAPLMKADLGLSNAQLGLAFSAFALPYAIFQLIGGWIGDRLGPRVTLAACCAVVTAATALTGATGGFASLFAARLALGFGEGAAFPTATRAMATWTPVGRWGFAQGITHSFSRIGNALTPALVAALLVFVSWRISFVILASTTLVWLLVWAHYYRDDPRQHSAITAADLAKLPERHASRRQSIPWMRLARCILPVTLVDFCYGWTLWLFLSWIPSFFLENYHLNLQLSAMFSVGVLSAGVIGDTVGGVVSDRLLEKTGSLLLARRSVIVIGFLGAFVFLLPVMLIHNLTIAAAGLTLAFFFAELIVAPIWSVPMDIAPKYAGTASGMMNFGFAVAGLVSPSSFGYLVDRTGSWVVPFIASIVLLLAGAALAWRLRPDRPFQEG
ncbi:MAG TPA: MFS transporter [Bryobacteraceae bacterium]|nr:MFS transporter [Bryobacteraceae bacterium]